MIHLVQHMDLHLYILEVQRIPTPKSQLSTLPETKIAPENGWLEDYFPFGMAYFLGLW